MLLNVICGHLEFVAVEYDAIGLGHICHLNHSWDYIKSGLLQYSCIDFAFIQLVPSSLLETSD